MNNLKKILLVCVLSLGLLLTSCFTADSTIGWSEFPDSIYTEGFDLDTFKEEVKVTIDGNVYSLNNLPAGVQVAGLDNKVGNYTLYVTYNGSSIMFSYNVIAKGSLVDDYDISWYNNFDSVFTICTGSKDENVNQLKGLAYLVNVKNYTFAGKKIVLANDVDLTGVIWTPIGEGARKVVLSDGKIGNFFFSTNAVENGYFAGTFDGNNKTITGLSNDGYIPAQPLSYTTSAGISVQNAYTFGLFGRVVGATIMNLTMKDVNIDASAKKALINNVEKEIEGDSVGCVVGYAGGCLIDANTVFSNITVSGAVSGIDGVGGICGKAYTDVKFEKCTNNATVTALDEASGKAGGICAYTNVRTTVIDCVNTGKITAADHPTAILRHARYQLSIDSAGNANSGNIYTYKDGKVDSPEVFYYG